MSGSPVIALSGEILGIITQAGTGRFRGTSFGVTFEEARNFLDSGRRRARIASRSDCTIATSQPLGAFLLAAHGIQEFLRRFSGVLRREVFIQHYDGNLGIDLFQQLARWLAVHRLLGSRR